LSATSLRRVKRVLGASSIVSRRQAHCNFSKLLASRIFNHAESSPAAFPRRLLAQTLPSSGRGISALSFAFLPSSLLSTFNFALLTPFLSTFQPSSLQTFQRYLAPNSFPLKILSNRHLLTPCLSHFCKNTGGRGYSGFPLSDIPAFRRSDIPTFRRSDSSTERLHHVS